MKTFQVLIVVSPLINSIRDQVKKLHDLCHYKVESRVMKKRRHWIVDGNYSVLYGTSCRVIVEDKVNSRMVCALPLGFGY
jgi:hypothetical protein